MTREQFDNFCRRLFACYPSLNGWLRNNSPDPAATLDHWFEILKPYELVDALGILAKWTDQSRSPWEGARMDGTAYMIRAEIDFIQDKEKKRRQAELERRRMLEARGKFDVTQRFNPKMKAAFVELRKFHRQMLDGEISERAYELERDRVLEGVV